MKCHRGACQSTNAVCLHTQNGHLYCPACAHGINEANPQLVLFPIDPVKELVAIQDSEYGSDQRVRLCGSISNDAWLKLLGMRNNIEHPVFEGIQSRVRVLVTVDISHLPGMDIHEIKQNLECRILSNTVGSSVVGVEVSQEVK